MSERGAAFDIPDKPRVVGVLATPRLGFTQFYMGVAETASSLGIPIEALQGCYPEIAWENAAKRVIKQGADYVLFLDYDTVFTASDVRRLIDIMQRRPDLAAVFACQASRHDDSILCDEPHRDYTGETTERRHGHLGLTLVRTEALKRCPQPWFMGIPGPSGGWDDPLRVDADIAFWRLLEMNGLKVAQANNVVVGHLELAILWPTHSGNRFQRCKDYTRAGKPGWAQFNPPAPSRVRIAGDGSRPTDGSLVIDGQGADDLTLGHIEDGTLDSIDARLVLQRFAPKELLPMLALWRTKLREGGELRVSVPDAAGLARMLCEKGHSFMPRFTEMTLGPQDGRGEGFRSAFDEATLVRLMLAAKFEGVERLEGVPKELPGALTIVGVRPVSSQLHSAKPTEGAPADADLASV